MYMLKYMNAMLNFILDCMCVCMYVCMYETPFPIGPLHQKTKLVYYPIWDFKDVIARVPESTPLAPQERGDDKR